MGYWAIVFFCVCGGGGRGADGGKDLSTSFFCFDKKCLKDTRMCRDSIVLELACVVSVHTYGHTNCVRECRISQIM